MPSRTLRAMVFVIGIAGCTDDGLAPHRRDGPELGTVRSLAAAMPRYLPRNQKVALGNAIALPPEPFDPQRDTLVPSVLGPLNLVGRADFSPPPRFPAGSPQPSSGWPGALTSPVPGDADKSLPLFQTTKLWYGVYQVNDVATDLTFTPTAGHDTGYVYAPTLLPPGHTCIEATTIHRRPTAGPMQHFQGWFDWCQPPNGAWGFAVDITDQVFQLHYVRSYLGKPTESIVIVTPTTYNGCWYAQMYDYQLGGWTQVFTSCTRPVSYANNGTSQGWSAWESYFVVSGSACVSLSPIRALNIQFADPDSGAFVPISSVPASNVGTPSISTSGCWFDSLVNTTGPYIFTYPSAAIGLPANSWNGNTAPSISVTIAGPGTVRPNAICGWTATPSTGTAPFTYTWTVSGAVVGTAADVHYQNTGAAFSLLATVRDAHGVLGTRTKAVAVSSSAPMCTN